MPKVSIIIPVYNARDSIVRCLDSVLAQTLDDIETILVDDHGPDDSIAVAKSHLADYSGPKAFRFTQTSHNSGPGAARNVGMEEATGEFLAFLDSDDTLEPDYCEKLYDAAKAVNADLACCQAIMHKGESITLLKNPVFPAGILSRHQRITILDHVVTYLWTYIVRREFIFENCITFPPYRSAEDSCFVISCWLTAANAVSIEDPLYNYYVQDSSVSRRRDHERWRQRMGSFNALKVFAKKAGLWHPYRATLLFVIFKKGWLLAAKDLITG